MSLLDRIQHTVTLVRPARVTDRRGDVVDDWAAATRTALAPAWIQQTSGTEARDERTVNVTRWNLYCRERTLAAHDRVEWQGGTYEVDGPPNHVEGMSGYDHTEAALVRLEA